MARLKSKHVAPDITSRSEAERAVGSIARMQIQSNDYKLDMDRRINQIREEHEGLIDNLDREIDAQVKSLETWARENPDEFPKGRKSIDFVHGTVGFRTGTPKVVKGKRHKTLADLAAFMRSLPWARRYVKQANPTVNRELLIADRDKLTADRLMELGISIVQDETFYVEPKAETLEQGATVPAA